MTEAVFAGVQVGLQGVSPDSSKLTAIVDWPIPEDASHLEGFLGLTSYFHDLVSTFLANGQVLIFECYKDTKRIYSGVCYTS